MTSYSQPRALLFTSRTRTSGVSSGPESKWRGSSWPDASILTWVPPTSMTRMCMLGLLPSLGRIGGWEECEWRAGAASGPEQFGREVALHSVGEHRHHV